MAAAGAPARPRPPAAEQLEDAALLMARPLAAQAMAEPAATLKTVEAGAAAGQIPTGFALSSPGMMVNFIMFSLHDRRHRPDHGAHATARCGAS